MCVCVCVCVCVGVGVGVGVCVVCVCVCVCVCVKSVLLKPPATLILKIIHCQYLLTLSYTHNHRH